MKQIYLYLTGYKCKKSYIRHYNAYFSRYMFAFVAVGRISKVPFGKYSHGIINPHFFWFLPMHFFCCVVVIIQSRLVFLGTSFPCLHILEFCGFQLIFFQSQLSALLHLKGNVKNFNRLFLRKTFVHIYHINGLPIFS